MLRGLSEFFTVIVVGGKKARFELGGGIQGDGHKLVAYERIHKALYNAARKRVHFLLGKVDSGLYFIIYKTVNEVSHVLVRYRFPYGVDSAKVGHGNH